MWGSYRFVGINVMSFVIIIFTVTFHKLDESNLCSVGKDSEILKKWERGVRQKIQGDWKRADEDWEIENICNILLACSFLHISLLVFCQFTYLYLVTLYFYFSPLPLIDYPLPVCHITHTQYCLYQIVHNMDLLW